ncbi:MAG: YkgJ family cysteine cluster protein [Desulfobacteraceae bacterium]
MSLIVKNGFDFKFDSAVCKTCQGYCCRGESGNVWVSFTEIDDICDFLNLNRIDGFDRYFDRVDNRVSVKETFTDGEFRCVFLDTGGGCSIYGVRPVQCRTFPFWAEFKQKKEDVFRLCPGVIRRDPWE